MHLNNMHEQKQTMLITVDIPFDFDLFTKKSVINIGCANLFLFFSIQLSRVHITDSASIVRLY